MQTKKLSIESAELAAGLSRQCAELEKALAKSDWKTAKEHAGDLRLACSVLERECAMLQGQL